MKLRIARKIYKYVDERRWTEATLERANRRMAKTASQKDANQFCAGLFSARNLLTLASMDFDDAMAALEERWGSR